MTFPPQIQLQFLLLITPIKTAIKSDVLFYIHINQFYLFRSSKYYMISIIKICQKFLCHDFPKQHFLPTQLTLLISTFTFRRDPKLPLPIPSSAMFKFSTNCTKTNCLVDTYVWKSSHLNAKLSHSNYDLFKNISTEQFKTIIR